MLGSLFYHPMPIWKLFGSAEERERWKLVRHQPNLEPYIEPGLRTEAPEQVDITQEALSLKHAGFVDTNVFLDAVRNWLLSQQCLIPEKLDPSLVQVTDTGVQYGEHTADRIVFCEGFAALQNRLVQLAAFPPYQRRRAGCTHPRTAH